MGTDPHPFHCVAASWVVTGQNLSLCLFLDRSLEETGQSLMVFSLSFFVEVTDQSLSHASSGPYLPLMNTVNQVFHLTKEAFSLQENQRMVTNICMMVYFSETQKMWVKT